MGIVEICISPLSINNGYHKTKLVLAEFLLCPLTSSYYITLVGALISERAAQTHDGLNLSICIMHGVATGTLTGARGNRLLVHMILR